MRHENRAAPLHEKNIRAEQFHRRNRIDAHIQKAFALPRFVEDDHRSAHLAFSKNNNSVLRYENEQLRLLLRNDDIVRAHGKRIAKDHGIGNGLAAGRFRLGKRVVVLALIPFDEFRAFEQVGIIL